MSVLWFLTQATSRFAFNLENIGGLCPRRQTTLREGV
jgi:hypothetical protein